VGVPLLENGESDFEAVDSATKQIALAANTSKLVVERSTVPVRTGEQLKHLLHIYAADQTVRFQVAANPQFLREGAAVEGFLHPDRVLLGIDDADSEQTLRQIYAPLIQRSFSCPLHPGGCPPGKSPDILVTAIKSAELIKHVSNAFLSVKISYANVLADLCERIGGDVQEVTYAVGLDKRIGSAFLQAGVGFGGDRLPKDLRAFCGLLESQGLDAGIPRAAEDVNHQRIAAFLEKTRRALWVLKDKRIGLLGLAHKADTDDVRGSPAIVFWQHMIQSGARVRAYDPRAAQNARVAWPELVCSRDAYEAAEGADALAILTEWPEFRLLDWQRIHDTMARPLVLDGRNLLSPASMKGLGFEYHSIGRPE
jgi:UDPglucose 6-dehydrogenase